MKKEIKELIKSKIEGMAYNHLSGWVNYYKDNGCKTQKDILNTLCGHDDSLEIEYIEGLIDRKLKSDEESFLIVAFHKKVAKMYKGFEA